MRRTTVDVAIGIAGVLTLTFAVSTWVTISLTGDPGSLSTGLGSLYAGALGLVSVALLGWTGVRIRRQGVESRRRSLLLVAVAASFLTLLFAITTADVVVDHRAEERALAAAGPVRDIEDELADAYASWLRDHGEPPAVYTGDYTEWWSLDPDGDGRRDQDAPVLRVLRGDGRTAPSVTMFDRDGDLVVDRLQWRVPSPTTAGSAGSAWCAPVDRHPGGILGARWHAAEPRPCDAPASSEVSAGP